MSGGSVLAHMTDANDDADEEMAQQDEQKRAPLESRNLGAFFVGKTDTDSHVILFGVPSLVVGLCSHQPRAQYIWAPPPPPPPPSRTRMRCAHKTQKSSDPSFWFEKNLEPKP